MKQGLTFDDVLLVPQASKNSPDEVSVKIKLSSRVTLETPILSASMDTVTEAKMAIAIAEAGGLGIIHKSMSPELQAAEVKKVKSKNLLCGASVSVGPNAIKRAELLVAAGVDVIITDVAHGHYYKIPETIKILKKKYGNKITLIGGNVATGKATLDLIKAGADAVKVGVGPGSICTTRIIAGVGVPQLTAVMDAVKVASKTKTAIIADGGIKYSGDAVKALAAGASAIMAGSLLAGTDQAPGKVIMVDGKKVKSYRGMGSIDAMKKGSSDRYLQENKNAEKEMIAEGVSGYVDYKGDAKDIILQLVGGIKQGLGYCGSKDIYELWKKAEFIQITSAGLQESHPHSLKGIQNSPNYESKFI